MARWPGPIRSGTTTWSGGCATFCDNGIITRPRGRADSPPERSSDGLACTAWLGDNLRGLHEKSVGKPDAGNRHVRFDERGRETGASGIPRLSSTLLPSQPEPNETTCTIPPRTHSPPPLPPSSPACEHSRNRIL